MSGDRVTPASSDWSGVFICNRRRLYRDLRFFRLYPGIGGGVPTIIFVAGPDRHAFVAGPDKGEGQSGDAVPTFRRSAGVIAAGAGARFPTEVSPHALRGLSGSGPQPVKGMLPVQEVPKTTHRIGGTPYAHATPEARGAGDSDRASGASPRSAGCGRGAAAERRGGPVA